MINQANLIHPTAEVSPAAIIGAGTSVWNQTRIREGAILGEECIIGTGVYIDRDVVIGSSVKIQNHAQLFRGVTLEDGVFIGPQACLANDRIPRAIDPDGQLKTDDDWTVGPILVRYGASVGARAVILPGVTIGRFAMVGAGAVVTRDVPEMGLVIGVPAELKGHVCLCGEGISSEAGVWLCGRCGRTYEPADAGWVLSEVRNAVVREL